MRMPSFQDAKMILIMVAAAAAVAVLTVILITAAQRRRTEPEAASTDTLEVFSGQFDPDDLIIPREYTEVWQQDWVPYRDRREVWTQEEIEPYWSDTKEVILELLEKQTIDALLRNLSSEPVEEESK